MSSVSRLAAVMTTVLAVAVLVPSALGQVPQGSTVQYTIALGGDNHSGGEPYRPAGSAFTPGSPDNGQTYQVGDVITWDARVLVSGVHSNPGGPGDGYVPNGAANLVFDLELHEGTVDGPLAQIGHANVVAGQPTTAGYFSTVNNGVDNGERPAGFPTGVQNAAFTSIFDIQGNGALGGRLIDPAAAGGPYMDVYTYPSAKGLPEGNTAPYGVLAGMGAGYSEFDPVGNGGMNTAGVGVVGLTGGGCEGLGEVPLFEGQISTMGLSPGTYVLNLVAGAGNNILSGDFDCDGESPSTFALAANQVLGDQIVFVLLPEPTTLALAALGGAAVLARRRRRA